MIYDQYPGVYKNATDDLNTLKVLSLVYSLKSYSSGVHYTTEAMRAYPDVNFRYAIFPESSLPGSIVPLNFDQDNLEAEAQLGIKQGREVKSSDDARRNISEKHKDLYYKIIKAE